jgi:hypothetical protein
LSESADRGTERNSLRLAAAEERNRIPDTRRILDNRASYGGSKGTPRGLAWFEAKWADNQMGLF